MKSISFDTKRILWLILFLLTLSMVNIFYLSNTLITGEVQPVSGINIIWQFLIGLVIDMPFFILLLFVPPSFLGWPIFIIAYIIYKVYCGRVNIYHIALVFISFLYLVIFNFSHDLCFVDFFWLEMETTYVGLKGIGFYLFLFSYIILLTYLLTDYSLCPQKYLVKFHRDMKYHRARVRFILYI